MPNINVPYQPVPQGQATPATPFMGDVATPQAFGVNIGRAEEQLGQTMDRASSALEANVLQIQGYKTEAEVNAGVTDYILKGGDLTNKFRQLPGSQAQDQLEQHTNDLDRLRQGIRSGLSSPKAQRDFDNATMHRFALDVVGSSQYAAQQMRQFTKEGYAARSDAEEQRGIKDVRDGVPGAIERTKKNLKDIERARGTFEGEDPDVLNKKDRDTQTRFISKVTTSMAETNPKRAYQILDEAARSGSIDQSMVDVIKKTIDDRAIETYATMDGAQIANSRIQTDPISFDKNPESVLTEMNQDAAKVAKERYPDDPVLAQRLENALKDHNKNSTNLAVKEQNERKVQLQNYLSTVTGTALPTGRRPINEQEANSIDPNFSERYDLAKRYNPAVQKAVESAWAANAKQDNILRPEDVQAQKNWWAGKTYQQQQEINPDDLFNRGKINNDLRNQFWADKRKAQAVNNNQIAAGMLMQRYRAILAKEGIYYSGTDTEADDKYAHMQGALQFKLQQRQQELGRGVKDWTPDEEHRVINELITQTNTGQKGLLGGAIQKPLYDIMNENRPDWAARIAPNSQFNPAAGPDKKGRWQYFGPDGKLYNIDPPGK